jgi:hypothetical protein
MSSDVFHKKGSTLVNAEVERVIIDSLMKGKYTVVELSNSFESQIVRCPDDLMRILSRMRKKGLIKSEYSKEKSAWVFWAER